MRANGRSTKKVWLIGVLAVLTLIVVVRWNTNSGPRPASGAGNANPPAADRVNEALGLHASQVATLAVQFAHDLGITLIGFVRGKRMNVYAHDERIID